ncbi:type II restriction endonuclease [Mycoplasmopsis agassizii]|uniref:type II restriction endonuclease n=1 Tax=Mycoplasmopsis agassizii TaxID=33922 RepID=UPI003527E881
MKNRDFEEWINTFTSCIVDWTYYTDFPKAYENLRKIKVHLNILNSLIGSKNIENDFKYLLNEYPEVLTTLPILLAKRDKELSVRHNDEVMNFNFEQPNYPIEKYVELMKNTGLFDLLENHLISSIPDYVLGIEVGLDTNARKNRTGSLMEKIVETEIKKTGFRYESQVSPRDFIKWFGTDLFDSINEKGNSKKFDFIVWGKSTTYFIEVNFYNTTGSKPVSEAGLFIGLNNRVKLNDGFEFVWITDGSAWKDFKDVMEKASNNILNLFNLNDLKDGELNKLFSK